MTTTTPIPLTRRWRIVSSPTVRERDDAPHSCTGNRTARARGVEGKSLEGKVGTDTPYVAVEWEDITAYSRTAIPEDFEPYRLRKLTYLTDADSLVSLQIESSA